MSGNVFRIHVFVFWFCVDTFWLKLYSLGLFLLSLFQCLQSANFWLFLVVIHLKNAQLLFQFVLKIRRESPPLC